MIYIGDNAQKIRDCIERINAIDCDISAIKSDELKTYANERKQQELSCVISFCDNILSYIKDKQRDEQQRIIEENKPVYFDILRDGVIVDAHWYSTKGPMLNGKDQLIRSYNSKNVVQFEDKKLAGLCEDYNAAFNKCMEEIQKKLSSNGSRLGLTTKFNEITPGYADANPYSMSKEEIDSVQLPDDEKLPKDFVDNYLSVEKKLSEPIYDISSCQQSIDSICEEISESSKKAKVQKVKNSKKDARKRRGKKV